MAEMRIKNLELLKRHQEIEEDRQLAQQSGVTTGTKTESSEDKTQMKGGKKSRGRNATIQQNFQRNPNEQMHRAPARRKFENDRIDIQPQRAQRVDYNRLKHERAQELVNQQQQQNNNNNSISPELLEYAYPFHHRTEDNYATRVGSGRLNQQQRTQDQGQRRREERMRRSGIHTNGHTGEASEFHLDIPQISMWQNGSLPPPIHVQLLPTNINGHHTGIDHFINNGGEQIDQSVYSHNFVYPSPAQSSTFNGNGPVYFAHPSSPLSTGLPSSQPSQQHFHQYYPTRTFENSNRHQFHHPSHFQSTSIFQPPLPPHPLPPPLPPTQLSTLSTSNSHLHQEQEDSSVDLPPRFRRLKNSDQDNKYSKQRPMSGDFERLYNSSLMSNDNRFQSRPQSFYDFSSQQQSNANCFRPSNNHNNNNNNNNNTRYQRYNNNNSSLPLAAYMNTNESSYRNDNINNNNNYWGTSYQKRRSTKQRTYHHDKHQFPLSSYDPRQYGFNNNYQRRNDFNNRSHSNRQNINNTEINDSNDINLIEEWWEDDNPELIGTNQLIVNIDSQPTTTTTTTTTVDDSGNSSLSTSIHLKESILDDEENNISTHDVISPPSNVSTTDSNIIESLDQLQQQLKLEEAVEKQLATENDHNESELLSSNKEPTTYETAHFLEWAKEKFREELAVRLTAQEIQQHDAVSIDEDDDDDDDIGVTTDVKIDKFHIDHTTDEDIDNTIDNIEELDDDLHKKLLIVEENSKKSVVVE
ncbi:unnamed protein product [Rotaria sp. Silwood1]|nr:unnamed protein product [Rotaria sp. Silwood1]CAF3356443.1 unnamed protein product [Rotaria sp. Silwood1]CAF3383357.1 unnamed protein product [Rotaria sp. Silwood1]CAF3387919.1 unnamed protein product [Rotaria sp. Silwood1]CAF4674451.1 unnamed protein product [Rotaria sp. Silwood1]